MPRSILADDAEETRHKKKRRSRKSVIQAKSKCYNVQQKQTLGSSVVQRQALLSSLCKTLTVDADLQVLLGRILRV
ncbi:MAG: hypothetical protein AB7P18_25070, partial [Candidatus Binatia bacterium]